MSNVERKRQTAKCMRGTVRKEKGSRSKGKRNTAGAMHKEE